MKDERDDLEEEEEEEEEDDDLEEDEEFEDEDEDEDEEDEDDAEFDALIDRIATSVVERIAGSETDDEETDDEGDDEMTPIERIVVTLAEREQSRQREDEFKEMFPDATRTQVRNFSKAFASGDAVGIIQAVTDASGAEAEVKKKAQARRPVRKKQTTSSRSSGRGGSKTPMRPNEAVRASLQRLLS